MAGGLLVAAALMIGINRASNGEPLLNDDAWARVTLQWSDSSTRDRKQLLSKTLEQFEEAPLLGQGFGTTSFWDDDPAHNSYLDLMADCGILGVLVLPGLVLAIRRKAWDFYAFAGIFLFWGFFNHQLLTELYALLTIAIQVDEPREVRHVYSALYLPYSLSSDGVRVHVAIGKQPAALR
jgi:O-antigen ligase